MEGYDVVTYDDAKVGHVVGRQGMFLIVEHGSIFKHRRPVPETFATVDEEAHVVRLTVSREILEGAPEVEDDGVDEAAAAEHYGLVVEPLADGDEEVSADQLDEELGLVPPAEESAITHDHLAPGQGPDDRGIESPGVTGGDRYRDR
jgi:hypothetical protein